MQIYRRTQTLIAICDTASSEASQAPPAGCNLRPASRLPDKRYSTAFAFQPLSVAIVDIRYELPRHVFISAPPEEMPLAVAVRPAVARE
jgi:hypothetical protein